MAIGDLFSGGMLTSNVLLKFKVDNSEAVRGLKQLTGEEKKAAEAAIALQEKKNKQLDSWAKGIAKVSTGMMLATKAVGLLSDSWKAYEKHAMAAGGADAAKAREFRNSLDTMGKAVDKFAVAIGGIVAELAPLVELAAKLVGFAADLVGAPGKALNWVRSQGGPTSDYMGAEWAAKWDKAGQQFAAQSNQFGFYNQMIGYGAGGRRANSSMDYARQSMVDAQMATGDDIMRIVQTEKVRQRDREAAQREALSASKEADAALMAALQERHQFWLGGLDAMKRLGADSEAYRRGQFSTEIGGAAYAGAAGQGFQLTGDTVNKFASMLANRDVEGEYNARNQRKLEKIFGPVEDFQLYAEGFNLLSGAATGAFDAWVSGSLTAGQAIKKFFADAVSSVASQMFAEAIKHGAFAIGSLAFGDVRGAVTHGKAAAAFGAGAVAVGAIARQLNGGGASAGASGGLPSVTGGGTAGAGNGGSSVTVIMSADFDDSPRMRQRRFGKAVGAARRYEGSDGVILQ